MKCKVRLWLLLLLFEVTASTSTGHTTTARYSNNTRAGNFLPNRTAADPNLAITSNFTDYGRKLKRRQRPAAVKNSASNTTFPNYVKLKVEYRNGTKPAANKFVISNPIPTKVPQKIFQVLNNNNKGIKSNNTRVKTKPKLKIKTRSTTRAPSVKQKIILPRNSTKLRIKPQLEKQASPAPEISVYSPEYPISGENVYDSIEVVADGVASSTESFPFGVPVSQVLLQSLPLNGNKDSLGNDCPTFQLSSFVYGPQLRQDCPDLNVVINSQYSQNAVTQRAPEVQADPVADEVAPAPAPAADPVTFDDPAAPAAAPAAGTNSGGATNSGGGLPSGGLPQLPELPGLPEFPDLKGLFDFVGQIWRLLSKVFRFLGNPYLYVVPATISFGIGFLSVLSFVPWWAIPAAFFTARNDKNEPEVAYYKHIHKPVHHYDEWFWNHNTKTWSSIFENAQQRVDDKRTALARPKLVRVKVSNADQ